MEWNTSSESGEYVILGISGRIGAGKTTIARYLVQHQDFQRLSYSAMLTDLYRASKGLGSEPNRRDLQEFGILLTEVIGHPGLTAMLLRGMRTKRVVVDGIRHYDSYRFLVQNYRQRFRLIFRDVPVSLRHRFYNEQVGLPNKISLADFQTMDNHPSEAGIDKLKTYAHFSLPHFEDIAQLYQAVDVIVSEMIDSAI